MGVKSYAEYNVYSNVKHPKFKVVDHVRISKYKNIFANGYTPNCSEELTFISKTKNKIPWTCYQIIKTNQKELRIEKVIKKKGNELYSNGKVMIIVLIVGLIKLMLYKNESILS